MNCHEFEMVVNDLARNQIMDAAAKSNALTHKAECKRCSARLADERMLTAGLAYLAESFTDEQAPPRTEAALVAALRENRKEVALPSGKSNWKRLAVAAAIALILIAVALVALRLDKQSPEREAYKSDETQQSKPHVAETPKPVSPAPDAKGEEKSLANRDELPPQARPSRRAMRSSDRTHTVNAGAVRQAVESNVDEITTDFIPLVQGDRISRMEGGQVVRVEMPRSALLSYGLPMNMERAGERIKADLVVGNDGLARAIRFVR